MRRLATVGALDGLLGILTGVQSDSPTGRTRHGPSRGFSNFESPQARPLALSVDGLRLYAVNTPAHSLSGLKKEIFSPPPHNPCSARAYFTIQ